MAGKAYAAHRVSGAGVELDHGGEIYTRGLMSPSFASTLPIFF
jgi:hypothetical protein